MPRTARVPPGGIVFHVLNRGVGKNQLFGASLANLALTSVRLPAFPAVFRAGIGCPHAVLADKKVLGRGEWQGTSHPTHPHGGSSPMIVSQERAFLNAQAQVLSLEVVPFKGGRSAYRSLT